MSNWCTVRNIGATDAALLLGLPADELRMWDGHSSGLLQRWAKVFRRELVRLLLLLLCWATGPCAFGRRGRMLWWSYGAFGSKGRLEGAQYLAGRRAPPVLR